MGSGGIAPPFQTWALDGSEWSASRPCRFNLRKRTPGIDWTGGWVDTRVGLESVDKRKVLHCRDSNASRPVCIPSIYQLSYPDSAYSIIPVEEKWLELGSSLGSFFNPEDESSRFLRSICKLVPEYTASHAKI
jgi:hypothetical protein